MSREQPTHRQHFLQFVTAQLQRLNCGLLQVKKVCEGIPIIQRMVGKLERRMEEMDRRVQLVEIYQKENFANHQRLFASVQKIELLDGRVGRLESQSAWKDQQYPTYHEKEGCYQKQYCTDCPHNEHLFDFEQRLREIEAQIYTNREKLTNLNQLKRDSMPPLIISDSTKDISIDKYIDKKQLKNIQNKFQKYLLQKFSSFEKKYIGQPNNQNQYQLQDSPYLPIRKARVKKINRQYKEQIQRVTERERLVQHNGGKQMRDHYYSDADEEDQYLSLKKLKKHTKGTVSSEKKIGVNKLGKSNKKRKKNSASNSKQRESSLKLTSVSEYLKIKRNG